MPELPEVEIVKKSLFKMINKARINIIKTSTKKLRFNKPSSLSKDLIGEKILTISRRSKYLVFHFKKKILLVHLGMTGKFFIKRIKDNLTVKTSFYYDLKFFKKHNHVYFFLSNGLVLIYNDVRRFGFFKVYNTTDLNKITFIKKLGLEPLSKTFNIKYFRKFVQNRKKNIKNLLMDQNFVSGLGNIYVNEVLFISRIKPYRICNNLNSSEKNKLILNIKKILKFSISKGGSSIKDFQNANGKSGNFQHFFYVYGMKNKKCSRISCTGKIKKSTISNRSTFYCNKCQN